MREIIDLPCGLFGPLVSDWVLNVRGRSAGEGVNGSGQVAYGLQPRWEATLELPGFGPDRVMTWRAIRARMRGRINLLRVCVCDMHRPKLKEVGLSAADIAMIKGAGIPHDDDTLFDDGTGYGYEPTMRASTTYQAGDESLSIDATPIGDALQPGQWFSHDDWPYMVTGVSGATTSRTYTFEPPLRRDIPAGADITLEATAIMAFETDLEGRMPLQLGRNGTATINLVEWTRR